MSAAVCRSVVSRDNDAMLSTAARPFVSVTSRTRSPAIVSSRPVAGPTRQFITSPPAPVVPPVSTYGVSSHGVSTIPLSVQALPAVLPSAQSMSYVSVASSSLNPPTGFQVVAATALPAAQLGFATSLLDCRLDVTVTTSSVVRCTAPTSTSSPVSATARSSRPPTIVLQQVHSSEVAWPTAQRATAPALTRLTHDSVADNVPTSPRPDVPVTTVLTQGTCDSVADSTQTRLTHSSLADSVPTSTCNNVVVLTVTHDDDGVADTVSYNVPVTVTPTRVTRDTVTDSLLTSTRQDIIMTVTPATVTSSSVSFALPYDRSTHNIVNVSPLSQLSSGSSSPSTDIPLLLPELLESPPTPLEKPPALPEKRRTLSEKPPPPYPGCAGIDNTAARPARLPSPTNDIASLSASDRDVTSASDREMTSLSASDRDVCCLSANDREVTLLSASDRDMCHLSAQAADIDVSRVADDSTDEDVAMTTECQRIESPKPVRRAGDDNRCETKVN